MLTIEPQTGTGWPYRSAAARPGPSLGRSAASAGELATPLMGTSTGFFAKLMDRIQELLRIPFQTEKPPHPAVPGTAPRHGAQSPTWSKAGDKVLVCINGYFSTALQTWLVAMEAKVQTIQRPWGEVSQRRKWMRR